LGVDAATVPQVIVTHAHYDHIGNLARFPAAEVLIARRELEFWTGPYGRRAQFAWSTEERSPIWPGSSGRGGPRWSTPRTRWRRASR
ncbi:MAG: MBL fold metallo-hydrolase, partial [Actinomadura sp.]